MGAQRVSNSGAVKDRFGRKVEYLRMSVTDRCNLRCRYCMPQDVTFLPYRRVLSYEELLRLSDLFIELGIRKIRITGGEPLIRSNILFLIRSLGNRKGLEELTLTTNGLKLSGFALGLREAGIRRVNVSIDSLDRKTFASITGMDVLEVVLEGIVDALKEGLVVKLNVVALRGINDAEFSDFIEFGIEHGCSVRFIEVMPQACTSAYASGNYLPCDEIIARLSKRYMLIPIHVECYSTTEKLYGIEGQSIRVGFISPLSSPFCSRCNRLRLMPDGTLKTCLFGDGGLSLKEMLVKNMPDEEIKRAIAEAVYEKPYMLDIENGPHRLRMHRMGG